MKPLRNWFPLATLLVAGTIGFVLWQQRSTSQRLRDDVNHAREENRVRQGLIEENQRLAAAQPTVEQLDRLRADHEALRRLKVEVEKGRTSTERMEKAIAAKEPMGPPLVPIENLKNAGRTTPAAAIETMLWAAGQADLDALARGFMWDSVAGPIAERMWTELPEKIRIEYGSLDRLMATFLARHEWSGLTGMGVAGVHEENGNEVFVHTRLERSGQKPMTAPFEFHRREDGWKFVWRQPALGLLRRLRDQK